MVRGTAREDTLAVLNGRRPWDRGKMMGEEKAKRVDWEEDRKKERPRQSQSGWNHTC
ncbi:hypothetical protein BDV24DRAFT_137355, partial [Aspergillus arachidicola]